MLASSSRTDGGCAARHWALAGENVLRGSTLTFEHSTTYRPAYDTERAVAVRDRETKRRLMSDPPAHPRSMESKIAVEHTAAPDRLGLGADHTSRDDAGTPHASASHRITACSSGRARRVATVVKPTKKAANEARTPTTARVRSAVCQWPRAMLTISTATEIVRPAATSPIQTPANTRIRENQPIDPSNRQPRSVAMTTPDKFDRNEFRLPLYPNASTTPPTIRPQICGCAGRGHRANHTCRMLVASSCASTVSAGRGDSTITGRRRHISNHADITTPVCNSDSTSLRASVTCSSG